MQGCSLVHTAGGVCVVILYARDAQKLCLTDIAFQVYPWYAVEDVLSVFGFGIHYDLFPPYHVRCQSSLVMVEATPVLERLNIYKIVVPTFLGIASEYQV